MAFVSANACPAFSQLEIGSMQRRFFVAAVCAAVSLPATTLLAAPVVPVIVVEEKGLGASAEQIRTALQKAAHLRSWGITVDKTGKMELVYPTNKRSLKYQATVGVTYGQGFYKIEYVKSRGLKEKMGCYGNEGVVCAHRNVNRWIANLGKDVRWFLTQ